MLRSTSRHRARPHQNPCAPSASALPTGASACSTLSGDISKCSQLPSVPHREHSKKMFHLRFAIALSLLFPGSPCAWVEDDSILPSSAHGTGSIPRRRLMCPALARSEQDRATQKLLPAVGVGQLWWGLRFGWSFENMGKKAFQRPRLMWYWAQDLFSVAILMCGNTMISHRSSEYWRRGVRVCIMLDQYWL